MTSGEIILIILFILALAGIVGWIIKLSNEIKTVKKQSSINNDKSAKH